MYISIYIHIPIYLYIGLHVVRMLLIFVQDQTQGIPLCSEWLQNAAFWGLLHNTKASKDYA